MKNDILNVRNILTNNIPIVTFLFFFNPPVPTYSNEGGRPDFDQNPDSFRCAGWRWTLFRCHWLMYRFDNDYLRHSSYRAPSGLANTSAICTKIRPLQEGGWFGVCWEAHLRWMEPQQLLVWFCWTVWDCCCCCDSYSPTRRLSSIRVRNNSHIWHVLKLHIRHGE